MILHARLWGVERVIGGVYIPPPFQRNVFDEVMAKISLHSNAPFILLGDYNAILDPVLDRLHPNQTHNNALSNWAFAHTLTKVWK